MAAFLSASGHGGIYLGLAIILIIGTLCPHLSSSSGPDDPLEFNIWTEDRQAIKKPEDPTTLYARERHCRAPLPPDALQSHTHKESTWSIMFSRYTMDAGNEVNSWLMNQEVNPATKGQRQQDSLSDSLIPMMFPLFFVVFLSISVFVIPILGAFGFHFFELIWWIGTHPEIRRFGRRLIIMHVKTSRRRERMLLSDTAKKPRKTRFRMPMFFRITDDEELPDELEESDDENWLDRVNSDEDDDAGFSDDAVNLSGLDTDDGDGEKKEILLNPFLPVPVDENLHSIGVQAGAIGVHAGATGVHAGATGVHAGTTGVQAGATGVQARAIGVQARANDGRQRQSL